MIKETVDLLGRHATDVLTGLNGVIVSVSFDVSGCVQAWIAPPAKDGAEPRDGKWFDVQRLNVDMTGNPMISVPDFDGKAKQPTTWDNGPVAKGDPRAR